MTSKVHRLLLSYGVAIAATGIALFLTLLLEPLMTRTIGAFFYIAIMLSTWYGGLRPGLVATVLSLLAINYYFIPPLRQFWGTEPDDLVRLCIFVIVAFIINLLSSNLRESKRKVEMLSRRLQEESGERLQTALAAAQMGMWDWDMVSGKITWSPEHESLIGLPRGSFDGKYETFDACLYPDDRAGLNQAIAHALQHRVPYHHEFRVIWADGSIHWIEGRGNAFYNAEGQPVRMSGTIMAIDERQQAQLLLNRQFEQQRLVAEITNRIRQSLNLQKILQTTVDGVRQFLQVDRVIIFQFTPDWGGTVTVESVVDDALTLFPFDIHDPCIGDRYVEPFLQGLVTAKADIYTADISPCHVEFLAQFQIRANLVVPIVKNGELWGLLAAHHCTAPRQWHNSEIDLLRQLASQVGVALQQAALFEQVQTELAERQQAEIALNETHQKMLMVLENMTDAYTFLDRNWCIAYANNASIQIISQLTGLEPEAILGKSHWDVVPWTIGQSVEQEYRRAIAEQVSVDLEFLYEPTHNWFEIHAYPSLAGLSIYYHDITSRKQAEIALKEREALLQLFAQFAPAGIAMFDREMRYVMASQRWVDEYNLNSVESLIGRSHYELFPEIPERWRQIHQRCLAGATEKCNDDLFVRSDGKQQWISWEIRPWHTATDEIGGIIIFSVDVTPRKLAEIELRDRERLFLTLAEALPVVIFRFDHNSHCNYISNYWTTLSGRTIESVRGLGWVETFHPQDRDRLTREWLEWSQKPQQQGIYQNEGRLLHADGRDIWYYIQALPEVDANGDTTGYLGVFTDITARKQAEASLRQGEARLRLAQTASNSAVWDWDVRTNTFFWSPEYYQLYGLDPTLKPTYERWLGCIYPDDREKASQQTLRALEESSNLRVEFRVMRLNELRWFAGIGQVLRDGVGQPIRMIGITIDITQQKQTELALQQLNTELEQRVAERTTELTQVNARLLETLTEQQHTQLLLLEKAQLLELAHDTIMTRDLNSVITFWNQGAEQTYGWTKDEALGQESHTLLKTQFPQPLTEIQTILQEKGYWEGELLHFSRDDRPIIAASRWVMQKDQMDRPIKILEINNDITVSKQAKQTLALQAVVTRNMAEGVCLVSTNDATIVYTNPKFDQMFGYNPGELNGQHVSIVNYATETLTAEDINQAIRSAVLQNSEATYEVHNVKKDGTPFWCSATCSVFKHPDYGDVLVAVHQDITDRKQAEAMLQQQAKLEALRWQITQAIRQSLDLRAILDTATEQIRQTLEVDRVAVYRFQPDWSGNFIAESAGDHWIKLIDYDTQKVCEDSYLQETQGGRFQNHETFAVSDIYTAGLQPCHIELMEQFQAKAYAVAPIFLREGLWGLLAIYQNATARHWKEWEIELLQQIADQLAIALQQSTLYNQLQTELQERKRASAVIQEAERRWRSLLDNVQLIVVGLDQCGSVNYVNPFFLTLTGYTLSEVLGKNWFENFLPSLHQQTVQGVFSEVLSNNAYPYYQNSILTKSGEERYIAWNNTMLKDIDSSIIGTISIGEDITERQKIDQMKQEFISIVSHELRTPLTSIRGSLGLIAGGVYDKKPEKMREMIGIAARQSDRLVRLVNDILDLRRLESGQSKFKFQQCSAANLIQQSVDVMRSQAEQNQIMLDIIPTTAEVWADADAIIQTLTNLLSNAIKFSPPNSTITLTATPYSTHPSIHPSTRFSVQDQGRGIPSSHLETIFGQFQQVDASDSREKGGTGLGLAICRTIVKQHSGKIWVESVLDQGSTFYIALPSAPPTSDNN